MRRFETQLYLVLAIGLLRASYGVWLLATPDHQGKSGEAATALGVGAVLGLASVAALVGRWPR